MTIPVRPFVLTLCLSLAALCASLVLSDAAGEPPDEPRPGPARFTQEGEMILPDDLDRWVFLGSTLGQGYNPALFDPDAPGLFQVVTMEPGAYDAFMETGSFPDGAMFALSFYGVESGASITKAGFTMGELRLTEIHLKDKARFAGTGFNFYMFSPGETQAAPLDLPNDCVDCHTKDGAHDGVFTQFYPAARHRLEQGN